MRLASLSLDSVLARGGAELITSAVHEAEKRTSGEIVVRLTEHLTPKATPPRQAALAEFERLELFRTKQRNAILIFIALEERAIELVADDGIAAVIEQPVWQAAVEIISLGFRCGFPAGAIVMAVTKVGDLLAQKFPWQAGDVNEQPDRIVTDEDRSTP
jgi:uncharacterized membrane protein